MKQIVSCHKGKCKDNLITLKDKLHSSYLFDEIELEMLEQDLK